MTEQKRKDNTVLRSLSAAQTHGKNEQTAKREYGRRERTNSTRPRPHGARQRYAPFFARVYYLPTQNLEKISDIISSEAVSPVISPSVSHASCTVTESRSSGAESISANADFNASFARDSA